MKSKTLNTLLTLLLVLGSASLVAHAQRRGMNMPRYDPATETTLRGEVTGIITQTGRHGMTGVHLTVETESGPVTVHLGPAEYLESQKFEVAEGDALEVVGSKVSLQGKEVVLARTVTKGETTVVLRDEKGYPKWAGAGRGGG